MTRAERRRLSDAARWYLVWEKSPGGCWAILTAWAITMTRAR